eukprot:COSAG06_NODE_2878_length_6140_cov_22.906307_5_plen_61_part_00
MVGGERHVGVGWGGGAGEMAEKRGVGGWCDGCNGNRDTKCPTGAKEQNPGPQSAFLAFLE